jgi:hypothetical protein
VYVCVCVCVCVCMCVCVAGVTRSLFVDFISHRSVVIGVQKSVSVLGHVTGRHFQHGGRLLFLDAQHRTLNFPCPCT